MRGIKFRVWDKANKIMVDSENVNYGFQIYLDGSCETMHYIKGRWTYRDSEEFILLQCTGLKDKNGVEIYEGDILQVDGEFWELFWKSSEDYWPAANYQLRGYKNNNYCKGSADAWMCSGPKVVGNIYENPELLKETPNDR